MMSNVPNIPFETLVDLADRRLPIEETTSLLSQLPSCDAETQEAWAWIQSFKTNSAETPAILQSTRTGLDKIFLQYKRGAWRRRLQRMVSNHKIGVSFDSWATHSSLAPVGARSAETASATRQLVFSTDSLDIALELRAHKATTVITGQILQNADVDLTEWIVTLYAGGDQVITINSDDLGEFELSAPTSQDYQLALHHLHDEESGDLITEPFGL